MSITIGICNDSDQSITESYECCENKYCPFCKGSGTFSYKCSKWTLNISNGAFQTFWSSLGFDPKEGQMYPMNIVKALKSYNKELGVTKTSFDTIGLGGTYIGCGITEQRIDRYVQKLDEICQEALKREEKIFWS